MPDAWIIEKLRKEQEQERTARHGIPLYAPQPVPPEWAPKPRTPPPETSPRGVIEDLDSEFRI